MPRQHHNRHALTSIKATPTFDEALWKAQIDRQAEVGPDAPGSALPFVLEIFNAPQSYWNKLNLDFNSFANRIPKSRRSVLLQDWGYINRMRGAFKERGGWTFQHPDPAPRIVLETVYDVVEVIRGRKPVSGWILSEDLSNSNHPIGRNNSSQETTQSRKSAGCSIPDQKTLEEKPKADKSNPDKSFDENDWLDRCNKNTGPSYLLVVQIFDAPQSYWNQLNAGDSKAKATENQAKRDLCDLEAVNKIRYEHLRRGNYSTFFREKANWPAERIIDVLHYRIQALRG